jgi:hypothetical protein
MSGTGTGTPAAADQNQTIIVIRDYTPGQVVTIVFLTPEQAHSLPAIPPDALQIAIAPAGLGGTNP